MIEYPGEVTWRHEPRPKRVTALGGESATIRRAARLRIRLEGGFVLKNMTEPSGETFAVGDAVVVTGPPDLATNGGQVFVRRA